MALSKEVYQALEDIVGPDNISDEPATLDSYAFRHISHISTGYTLPEGAHFMPRAEAVLLPGSTEEVQAIVRACNRYRIKVKAYCTGDDASGSPYTEGVIQLDLRRMDRILEIDEQNMFAVVEPYVLGHTLQAEAMKVGLNTHMCGAGAFSSPLASATSFYGPGPDSIFMGTSPENLLAEEWVMPTGDILRTGSLGSRLGWFCGEGPGPSTRGIVRGALGAFGGMGVFTKCALKLYPWPGPAVMPVEGTAPAYNSPVPDNFRAYTLAFPTRQAYTDALYKIYDAGIGYIAHRQFNFFGEDLGPAFWMMYQDPTKTLDDLEELVKKPEIQKLTEKMRYTFQFVLAGMTPRDIEYQEKVLDQLLTETGGHKVAAMSEPAWKGFLFLYLIKLGHKNLNSSYGKYHGSFCQRGTPDFVASYASIAADLLRKYQEKGGLVRAGGDSTIGEISSLGGGGAYCEEFFFFWDPHDKESLNAAWEYYGASVKIATERDVLGPGTGALGYGFGMKPHASLLPKKQRELVFSQALLPAPLHWQWKIKKAFDPNDIGDANFLYIEEPDWCHQWKRPKDEGL